MSWIKEEYRKLDQSPSALRRFGLLVGGVFLLLAGLLIWRQRAAGWPLFLLGATLVIGGVAFPRMLKWVHAPWMLLALVLGAVVSRILLTLLFYLVVTPIGFFQRCFGKRTIEVAFQDNVSSYWQERTTHPIPKDYERQF
jgi:hypothetical protein